MKNMEKVINELANDVEKLANLLVTCKDITGWDEVPTYRYITSDGTAFDSDKCCNAEKEALDHEIEWLKGESMSNELVTMEIFIQQVLEIEGVRIELKPEDGAIEHLVRAYDYPRLPDDATVDDLKARINECVNKPFITFMNI